jgi:Protein of unknown function (DUF4239)
MSSTTIGLISVVCIFGGVLFGLALQRYLPSNHLSKESHEIVKLGAGLIATFTAVVMGLLVNSTKGSFDVMNASIVQGGAKVILLDRVLAHYGPETKPIRVQLKSAVSTMIEEVWPARSSRGSSLTAFERLNATEATQDKLRELEPQNAVQRQVLAQAQQLTYDLAQVRWLLIEQAQNRLPVPFLIVVLFWLAMLFLTFGLFAPRNATVVALLFICACSVSAALFLIVEMNRPLDGVIKLSDAPLRKAMQYLGQ